jgi:hypothetical protein
MKSSSVICGTLCCIVFAACVTEEFSAGQDRQSADVSQGQSQELRDIPPELQLARPAALDCGGVVKVVLQTFGTCQMKITCHDPNFGCAPTFCSRNGQCGGQAPVFANEMCRDNCSAGTACPGRQLAQGC